MKPDEKPQKNSPPSRSEWSIDMRSTALFVIAGALIVALFPFLHRGSGKVKWPLVQGSVQDTRIVADHSLETKWGSELTWKAEYRVAYSVASRDYSVWADAGVRGESEADVRLNLTQSRPSCLVQYNPKKPEASVANCR